MSDRICDVPRRGLPAEVRLFRYGFDAAASDRPDFRLAAQGPLAPEADGAFAQVLPALSLTVLAVEWRVDGGVFHCAVDVPPEVPTEIVTPPGMQRGTIMVRTKGGSY